MTHVRFHTSWRNYLSEKQMSKVRDAFHFALDYHDLRDKNHTVDVYFVEEIDDDHDIVGRHLMATMKESKIFLKVNRFTHEICVTVFHEMTHLKQYLHYDICYTQFGKTWRGSKFPMVDPENMDTYWNAAHEIDARTHQRKMFWKWTLKRIAFWKGNKA